MLNRIFFIIKAEKAEKKYLKSLTKQIDHTVATLINVRGKEKGNKEKAYFYLFFTYTFLSML